MKRGIRVTGVITRLKENIIFNDTRRLFTEKERNILVVIVITRLLGIQI
jgi:hypothetical protein